MSYVDGFVLAVPKKNLKAYRTLAKKAGKIWREYGAIDYKECVGDDINKKGSSTFPKSVKLKSNEVVFFSFIVYKNRAHRNKINKQVMNDPRIKNMCTEKDMPFDFKRMLYGGFKTVVSV